MSDGRAPTRLIFLGTPEFASIGLKALLDNKKYQVIAVVTQPDKPAGRGGKIHESPVKVIAQSYNIPILQPVNIRKESNEVIEKLKSFGPVDVGVVIAFGQILPQSILSYPRAGCINVHASLLPRWRGAAPIQRAIMAGDTVTGVCLMHMEAGLDTGAVYSRSVTPITSETTAGSLHDKLAEVGSKLLVKDLKAIVDSELTPVPQENDGVTYASKITPQDCLINWQGINESIERQIRGLSPHPGAFSMLDGRRLKIFSSRSVPPLQPKASIDPGKIAFVDSSRLEIECGQGNLAIYEVQMEGKRRLPIKEFLKGTHLDTTMKLTDK